MDELGQGFTRSRRNAGSASRWQHDRRARFLRVRDPLATRQDPAHPYALSLVPGRPPVVSPFRGTRHALLTIISGRGPPLCRARDRRASRAPGGPEPAARCACPAGTPTRRNWPARHTRTVGSISRTGCATEHAVADPLRAAAQPGERPRIAVHDLAPGLHACLVQGASTRLPTAPGVPGHSRQAGELAAAVLAAPASTGSRLPAVSRSAARGWPRSSRPRERGRLPRGYRCTGNRSPITARLAGAPLVSIAPGTRPSLGSTDRW
jgi:hypothetical protein